MLGMMRICDYAQDQEEQKQMMWKYTHTWTIILHSRVLKYVIHKSKLD